MSGKSHEDIIAAIATPPGRGGIGILRLSGPELTEIGAALLGRLPAPRKAALRRFLDGDGNAIDDGLAIYFPKPHSFTGEDVLELHGHGGPVVLDMLLKRATELGVRQARPGEFSERAFQNDKLDLAQAEAIADLIESGTTEAARAALRSLEGKFSDEIHSLSDTITELRTYVEAAIDFPEEEIDFLKDEEVTRRVNELFRLFDSIRNAAKQGTLLRDGMTLVIAGRPNAGKSSLLNRLAGYEAAIVTEIPGTTRDVLRERIQIDGMPLNVIDTAGLHESGDVVEAEGMRRAREEMQRADRVLLVIDSKAGDPEDVPEQVPDDLPVTIVRNKIDLTGEAAGLTDGDVPHIALSAITGDGIDLLRRHLADCV
ncbi:MAG: tRNA uridine-5-carboxymethylaminomethyl(34) synthesis GTPase MnmE, partial [Gammaproteobacteria bacterium]